jgi:hypothetical protein
VGLVETRGQTEIGQFDVSIFVDQDVVGLDITARLSAVAGNAKSAYTYR